MFCFLSFCTFFKPMDPDSESIPGFSGLLYSESGSRSLKKAGLGTPFFSVQNVTFFYVLKKESYVLFRSFLEFLATYGTQKNVTFFWKERMPNPEKRYKMTKNNVLRSRSQNFGQKWSKKGPGAKKIISAQQQWKNLNIFLLFIDLCTIFTFTYWAVVEEVDLLLFHYCKPRDAGPPWCSPSPLDVWPWHRREK